MSTEPRPLAGAPRDYIPGELDDGKACENCWKTGRGARIKEDARSGRWLCHECEPHPTTDGLRRLPNGGLGEPIR